MLLVVALGALMANASTSTTPRSRGVVTITYADKGKTIDLNVGQTLRVLLDNTYWSIGTASNPDVLALHGQIVVAPRLSGCVAGQGCGTVTGHFRALRAGTVSLSASRASCGEALRCTGGNGAFEVTVHIT